ncbi:MAG TPA: amino acid adenylation domain-containing protein [Actinophytocola sp.]|uniref:non-ribosomal peptide synthetase n=1 Tax=Actinophytocola sp. TaxID=1872138 RepID=UPI002DBDB82C|nr:amino acid adenylation domain-containing protein [Actinophytocola sp.]HEU5469676.1 amino acid adenylation domain-containing protein [Actinophytocola sp.]
MLSDTQRSALIARVSSGRNNANAPIGPRPAGMDPIPLSHGQEQLWFIEALAPGLPTYNITGALHITGPLDHDALRAALDAVFTRHEVLRTRLLAKDGRPYQVIDEPPGGTRLEVHDLAPYGESERETRLHRLREQEAGRPFDVDGGPLIRLHLACLSAQRHVLLIAVHHTIFDGWSFGVFTGDLLAAYEAKVAGGAATLPELQVQFADYAVWERNRLHGRVLDELVDYWTKTLGGAPNLSLPTDRPRPPVQSYAGGLESTEVDRAVLDGLRAIARTGGTTLFATLMAAFNTLLHRYTGQDDLVVGTVSANRTRTELTPLIGYLVNTLAIRVDCSGDPTFLELLDRVGTATLGAYAHQDLPFVRLVDALGVHRDPSRHPVFQVGFNVAEGYETGLAAAGLTVGQEELFNTSAKFDLLLTASALADRLRIVASYASALFDPDTIARLLRHFQVLLEGIVADPRQRLSALPLLSDADRVRELAVWNGSSLAAPPGCLHEWFERQAARIPDAVAVELDGAALTYAQLNVRANQVAHRLRELGVRPENLVGVCMGRGIPRIAALLGVLKSGGGYLPLDPEYPADRLGFMLEDAHVPVVVTDADSAGAVPAGIATALRIEEIGDDDAGSANPAPVATAANVAYVIYTSGSTGRPKGVVIEHRQAVNFAFAEIGHWSLADGDRVLQFASLNFDVSVLDIFGALVSGATLVLGRTDTLLSPPRLAELIRRERITFMCLPPAVLELIADEDFPDLRVVIAGGEALSSALVRRWVRPGLRFVNGYGPTETTVGATMLECTGAETDPLPIGRPLANYTAHVLDRYGNLVPVGVAGELHIGGAGVARGYLNRPELTAQRFVDDSYGDAPDGRLYKTGDLARRMSDGNLQYLGRLDDQVKIRGLRIELGEIETVLAQHPAVRQAVVVVREQNGNKELVGYVKADPAPPRADLRAHLAGKLPHFMIPAHLLVLDSFPLNANGKVDRSRLPEPAAAADGEVSNPPSTVVEALVVDTFGALLGHDRIGVDDSFFELGGNSLQAMQLIARLREEFQVDTDLTAIFLAPTPAQLAVVLREVHGLADSGLDDPGGEVEPVTAAPRAEPAPSGPLVRLSTGTGGPPLFLIHAIGGTVHGYAALARELAGVYQVWGIEAAGLRPGSQAVSSLAEMVDGYADLIRSVQPDGPYRLGGWSLGGLVALRVAERLGAEVSFVALLDAPTLVHDTVPTAEAELAGAYVTDAARLLGPDTGQPPDPATHTAVEQLAWLADRLITGERDQASARAEIERRFQVYRAHYRLIAGYTPRPLDTDVVVVTPTSGPDDTDYWTGALGRPVRGQRVPGDHYSFLEPPGVQLIGSVLTDLAGR